MKNSTIRKSLVALLAAIATSAIFPAHASNFTISGSGNTFTVTRSDTNAAETVRCRAVSRSALAGLHFMGNVGRLDFAAGERSKSVSVPEYTAAQINDPRFTYYQSNGATGSSRTYLFEVTDDGGFPLASADRAISYAASNSVSSAAFATAALTVSSGEITVKDTGFAQAYHAVPLESYFSSFIPRDYLVASGANLRMLFDLQAAEVEDGYQYIQILADQTSSCDAPTSGSNDGDPGTPRYSRYMAGFEHKHGGKDANFKNYTFPVVSTNDNCGATLPWSGQGNDIGNLVMQRFNTNCRAADGRLAVPSQISTLGLRFTASGSGNDDWVAKSVVARLQAVPSGPSLLNVNPAVTPAPVCKGSVVSVSLPFNEIVTVTGTPTLSTTWGDLAYVAGSGANVLTFAGPVTAAAGTALQLTGLSGTVKGLTGTSFAWSGRITVSGRTVDTLAAPPRVGLTYELSTPAHLRWFADRLAIAPNTSAALAADIDLSNVGDFVPMGGANGFMGTFDGRGHVLSGLSVSTPDVSGRYGLFGLVAAQGVVSNLVLSGATVSASANPALVGAVCGRNLGTIALCSVLGGEVSTGPRSADGTGTALGGVCGENAGAVRACRVVGPLGSIGAVLYNRVKNDTVGGVVATNAVSGVLESCYFHASFSNVENVNITRGAVCGSNAGTVRNCVGLHDNYNYFDGCIGSNTGTVEDSLFPYAAAFSSGEVCHTLNGGVTDGSQPWYQALGTDDLPVFSGSTVYFYGNFYSNEILEGWRLLQAQLDAGGTVTLTNDVTAADGDASLTITKAVTLDLNGHTIDADGRFRVIQVLGGGDLILTNSIPESGAITGGKGSNGGGVYVLGGTFEMTGGAISGNTADDGGGGVYVVNGGRFTMTGGAISGNTADDGGGGVYVYRGGTFEMTGGEISGNTASSYGGGVYVNGTFTVSGSPVVSGSTNSVGAANNVYLRIGKEIAVSNLTAGARIGVTTETTPTVSTSVTFATGVAEGEEAYFFSDKPAFAVDVADGALRLRKIPTPWDLLQAQLDAGGTVTLTNDVTATSVDATLTITHAVTLDLNGHTLDAAKRFRVIRIGNGGNLTLTNSIPESGAITGGTASEGGGVYVNGTFTMTGGAISGNTASWGGGVYVDRGGTFEMAGGAISGNTAEYAVGGVYVEGTFMVSGSPVVSGSTNSVGAANNVYLYSGRMIAVDGLSPGARIGVTTASTPTATDPVTFAAGVAEGEEAYFFSDNPALAVDAADGALRLRKIPTPWDSLQAQLDAGGTVTLTNDVAATDLDAALTVTNAVTLDLNGHTLDAAKRFRVIEVRSGGNLTLTNSIPESGAITGGTPSNGKGGGVSVANGGTFTMAGGAISGNTASWGGGVYVSGGTFTMAGGAISGNTASNVGGGVYVEYGGTFEMTGGEISRNTATTDGGGVYVYGTFTMAGGEISGNSAMWDGGGVYVDRGGTFEMAGGEISGNTASSGGGGVYVYRDGTFEMTGGAISGNTASNVGGGVYVNGGGTFEMTGGAISGNTASSYGGGVYVNGTFTVSGSPVVSGSTNSVGAANNVYLYSGRTIAVDGLSPGARIGVTTRTAPTATDPVTFATGAAEGEEAYFFSDDSGCHVERDGSALLLVEGAPQGFTDPEGREIEDPGLVDWLEDNGFTQSDINALGKDTAATDKLYECWLLNCSIKAENPGGALSITGFAVSNGVVSVTVQLVRQSPLGFINGVLYLYGADDLASGFSLISEEIVGFGADDDPMFDIDPYTDIDSGTGLSTQSVTATFDTSFGGEKFFKAAIGFPIPEEPWEEPWDEPEPEEPDEGMGK